MFISRTKSSVAAEKNLREIQKMYLFSMYNEKEKIDGSAGKILCGKGGSG